jgi:chitinase
MTRAMTAALTCLMLALVGCGADSPEGDTSAAATAAACAAAPPWTPGVTYATGALASYQGTVYRCVQGHTALSVWPPDIVPALWQPASCGGGGPPPSPPDMAMPPGHGGSGGGGGGGTGGGGGNPPPPPTGALFVGYYQSWSDSWKANGADTVLAHLPAYVNVVNLSFMEPNASYAAGSISLGGTGLSFPYDGPTLRDAVKALHAAHPGTRVLVSVGGATYPSWSSFNPQAVAAFVNDFGLDGVDLDYEPSNAGCSSNGSTVTCPSDGEYVSVVNRMRAALPRPKWVTIAAWSVGAYGEGTWASAPPQGSAYMGIALSVLKQAAGALDLVNVMSYDASPAYNPQQALAAYRHYFSGRIAMGIETPPEAWGGHVETVGEIDTLADAVNAAHAGGLMLWSIQKAGPTQQFATEMCNKLGLGGCNTPML